MNPISIKSKPSFFFYSTFLLLCIFCFATEAIGQPLQYANLSFSEALAKAKSKNQIVFIQLESDCLQCNSVADKGLSGNDIGELFAKFICIKVPNTTEDYQNLLNQYRIYPNLPTSLFIDSEGNYLSSLNNFSTSNRNEYFKLAAKAMANKDDPPFKKYTEALKHEKYNKELLRQYITKLNEQNFNVDDLLEKYILEMNIKELDDENEVAFLIRSCPIINSRTYQLIRQNLILYNKVFESFPMEERILINRKIIAKSKSKAFREKDSNYLSSVLNFLYGSYGKDNIKGYKARQKMQLDYYKETKDSRFFFNMAKNYYSSYLEKINIDSISKAELNQTIQGPDGLVMKGGQLYQTGNELNDIAFAIYELSNDKEQLGFALTLSEKTLEYNVPAFIDTYARILYRLGGKKDAIEWQQKAISIGDSMHQPNEELKKVLVEMQNGTL
jgi:hypothetical protein